MQWILFKKTPTNIYASVTCQEIKLS